MTSAARYPVAQARALRTLTGLFGVVWLVNAAFQAKGWLIGPAARAHFLRALGKPATQVPAWIQPLLIGIDRAIQAVGAEIVAALMVVIAVLLGLALLTRTTVAFAARFGLIYSLICWVVLNGFGFPYSGGQTDPGVFMAYAIAFLFVLAAAPALRSEAEAAAPVPRLWHAARIWFGLLWLFDAALKWLPAFLLHFRSQITSVIPGEPHWIAAWLGFVAQIVVAVGPVLVAVVVGLSETVIAVGLLARRALHLILPFAFLYSLAVWATAEAFGGPYTAAGTGVRGNVLGNVLIYLIPLVFLWVGERPAASQ
jgi:hypothetical protein